MNSDNRYRNRATGVVLTAAAVLTGFLMNGCSPTVKIEAPDKPITINMNIKIDHEIRIKVDKDLDSLMETKKGLF
ncbi:MAG TPA: YnbE family lipoprotein [Chlorobaculum sp.]|nr:YnbE family lipoprotein [Chlorobaculum sp.]